MSKSVKNVTYEIPPQGSLGLLAYGHRGLEAWREAREKKKAENSAKQEKK